MNKKLEEYEHSIKKKHLNWDDYEIPKQLPLPKIRAQKFWVVIVGCIVTAIVVGFLAALSIHHKRYTVALFEVGIGIGIAFCATIIMRAGHYINAKRLHLLMIITIALTYILNQYFQYLLFLGHSDLKGTSFIEFIQLHLGTELTSEHLRNGWLGMLALFAFQIGFTWLIVRWRVNYEVIAIHAKRVPAEVAEFAYYHIVKGKNEADVRKELEKMGWSSKAVQDHVFTAVKASFAANELFRKK